jgi:hypothetical protein
MGFDPTARTVHFRRNGGREVHEIPHARLRRVALLTPLTAPTLLDPDRIEQVPATAHQREYDLTVAATGETVTLRSSGHVEDELGLFLWLPTDTPESLQRIFIPRHYYTRFEFGPSVSERATRRWITEPKALLQAIADQEHKPVRPIGESLLALGMLTQHQIDDALAKQTGDKPLGEMLVDQGVLSRADLRTAIAHKMGVPLVDLDRFPVDPEARLRIPEHLAVKMRAVPLMVDGRRVILAVESPERIRELQKMRAAYQNIDFVAVVAPKLQILRKLDAMRADEWSEHVPKSLDTGFNPSTTH